MNTHKFLADDNSMTIKEGEINMKLVQVFNNVDVNSVEEVEELEMRMHDVAYELENGIYDVQEVMDVHSVNEQQAFDIIRDELAVASKAFTICGLLLDNMKG